MNGKQVDVNDKNLPIFTYLAKVSKRIAGMPDKNFVVNEDYKDLCCRLQLNLRCKAD
ncbi:MAG: hypothetical protein ACLSA2_10005 [Candidatus Gastranaerophilaceae bacterium]